MDYKLNSDWMERLDSSYFIRFNNKEYILIYLSNQNSLINKRGLYLGLLFDLQNNKICEFPKFQNTNSILPIVDIDLDDNIDYISYMPTDDGTILIYKYEKGNFILNKNYFSILKNTDGYIWIINDDEKDFVTRNYKKVHPQAGPSISK